MSNDEDHVDGLPPGTVLSDTYEIVRQIGLGGMAEVYRARNIHTDEPVAIKVVLPEFSRDQTNVALFRKEATVLSRLHHDAIVRYHTFTIEKSMKRPYLVMEFVDGVPLSDHIKKAPLNANDTRVLISRIAAGLAVAHSVDVIHRDLSPDNVILPEDDVAKTKIVDFGIAKAGKIGEGTLLGGKFAGKYNFVSPEQLGLAGGEVTGQSDIYSLGLIAAAAQLGKPLDMSGSQLDVLEKRRTVPDLSGLDPSIRPIVAAMLQPLPENRPKTMAEVIAMLDAPPPRMLNDTGTVFGAEMPYTPSPPARDPWAEGRPPERSIPPVPQGSWPAADRSQPPSNWPPQNELSQPPQTGWPAPNERSLPPQTAWPAAGERSLPPQAPPEVSLGTREPAFGGAGVGAPPPPNSPPRSESPFGPGPSTAPPTFGKTPKNAKKKSGGGGGLIAVLAVLVLLIGGGVVFFLQGGFGLLGSGTTTVTPTTVTPTAEPTPTVTPTTTPTTETPAPTPTAETTTIVADTPTPTPTPRPNEVLDGAGKRLAWLKDYKLDSCQFAAPVTVADNAMTIEAYGNAVEPFEKMVADFQKDNGFEPDVGVRLIVDPQCAVADFLRAVQPLSKTGPELTLSTDNLPSGGALQGTITGTEGWTTDLLLVDYRGGVQNLSVFLTPSADEASFALPPLNSKTAEAVPMMIVAISNKGGLNTTRLVRTHEARQIFPVIQREIEGKDSDVSVTVKYFKLGGSAGGQ